MTNFVTKSFTVSQLSQKRMNFKCIPNTVLQKCCVRYVKAENNIVMLIIGAPERKMRDSFIRADTETKLQANIAN